MDDFRDAWIGIAVSVILLLLVAFLANNFGEQFMHDHPSGIADKKTAPSPEGASKKWLKS